MLYHITKSIGKIIYYWSGEKPGNHFNPSPWEGLRDNARAVSIEDRDYWIERFRDEETGNATYGFVQVKN